MHGDGVSKSERDVKDLLNPEYSVSAHSWLSLC